MSNVRGPMTFLDRPQELWWRKALFQVHLWAGVVLGLYVLAISLSGSILVFQRDIENDAPTLGNDFVAVPVNYDEIVAIATHKHPNESFNSIDLRTRSRRVIPVGLLSREGERTVYIDSVSKAIVGDVILQQKHPVTQFLMRLHNELLAGRTGAILNGVGGLALTAMCVSGIVLWWPGRKNWKRVLKVKWNARWARVNWDMHSAFGFWALLFVAMWAATGAYFIWPQQTRDAIAKFSPMPHMQEKPSYWAAGDHTQPVQHFIDKASAMYPKSQLAYVYMDTFRANGTVKIFLSRDPQQSLLIQEDVVTFHPSTLEVLSDISTSNLTVMERLSLAVYSIHFGDFGGIFGKIIWCVVGLVPALLAVTGYLMWWNRVLKKRWPVRQRVSPILSRSAVQEHERLSERSRRESGTRSQRTLPR